MLKNGTSILFIGVNILSGNRTGGMYYTFKLYDHFRQLPGIQINHLELSGYRGLVRLRLISLYLIAFRYRRYDYIFIDGTVTLFPFLLLSRLRGVKIVCCYYHFISREQRGLRRLIWQLKERLLLKITNHKVFISNSTLEDAREIGFACDDYVLAVPGIDKEIWIDRTLGYDAFSSGFKVICVASITPHKGIMDLLVAFADFLDTVIDNEKRKEINLDIVGNDQINPVLTSELRRVIQDRGLEENIILQGRRNLKELMGFYLNASVFVHPSHYEGWGIVVLEAASFGLPIIVSNGGSLLEVVNEGEYGIIYQVGDRVALRKQLEMVYRDLDLRIALSAKTVELYQRSITWEESCGLIETYLGRKEDKASFME